MSNPDSFIDEVTEEVRRDRLYRLMRRYGWIAILVVVLIVGGAAWNEWRKAQDRAAAEALGDSILAALESNSPEARAEALEGIDAHDAAVVAQFMAAEAELENDPAAAADRLQAIADDATLGARYRHLATLKRSLVLSGEMPPEDRIAALDSLAQPGAPYRLLAQEQIALAEAQMGETDAAIERLQNLIADGEVTAGLRRRASQLIVALGGSLEAS